MDWTKTTAEPWLTAACAQAVRINEDNLKKILADNQDTIFGRERSFASIHSAEEYRRRIPLFTYAGLQPYIERMRAGEENVLTAYPVAGFCTTSGTEEKPKYIPVSETALERFGGRIEWYKNLVHGKVGGKRLFVNGFRIGLSQKKEEYLLSELYYQRLFREGLLPFSEFAGGEETLFGQKGNDMLYAKVWTAFAAEDVTTIESIFLYDQLLFFQYMQKHWRSILKHMAEKRIPDRIRLTEKTRTRLLSMPVSRTRLQQAAEECRKGFDGIAERLWSGLVLSSGISNAAFEAEDKSLRRYLGRVPVYYFAYVASECHMGVALQKEDCRYVMLPESAFYEYLPWRQDEEDEAEETLLPGQVQEGGLYELVLTTFSGLYRYRLGDVVRVTGFLGESPVVEFVLRKNQLLNVAGEKMSIFQAEHAVLKLIRERGLPICRYCIGQLTWKCPSGYGAVFELEEKITAASEKQEEDGCPDEGLTAKWLDRALGEQNPDYLDVRRLGFLKRPEVLFLEAEEYTAFQEECGLTGGHGKPRHAAGGIEEKVWKRWKEEGKRRTEA